MPLKANVCGFVHDVARERRCTRLRSGRVTAAPGTLLRGSDAPDKPQFFTGISLVRNRRPIWVMVAGSRLASPGGTGLHSSVRPTRNSTGSGRSTSCRVSSGTHHPVQEWAGARKLSVPFPCSFIRRPYSTSRLIDGVVESGITARCSGLACARR
jgi:hypothetical protein